MRHVSRRQLLAVSTVLALGALSSRALGAEKRIIYVLPLGKALPDADVQKVAAALRAFYEIEVKLLPRTELPKSAYYAKRARYRAEKLLAFLQPRMPSDGFRILGLTGSDISTTKGKVEDWGILGLASIDGVACVVSSFRCKRGAKGPEHARIRLGKVAVHEIGHTFGLDHCPNRGCLMEDGGGSVLTTDREYDLCTESRKRLVDRGIVLADGAPPWPKPK